MLEEQRSCFNGAEIEMQARDDEQARGEAEEEVDSLVRAKEAGKGR